MTFHLAPKETLHFEQSDPALVSRSIHVFNPKQVFSGERLFIAGDHHVTALEPAAICYIDLQFDVAPEWSVDGGREIVTINEAEFEKAVGPEGERVDRREQSAGDLEAYVVMAFANGDRLFFAARGPGVPAPVRARSLLRAMDSPCVLSRFGEFGFRLVNTANLRYVASYPGPPEVPATAIQAHQRFES